MEGKDINGVLFDSSQVTWPARKITIGDSKEGNSIVYQIGTKFLVGHGESVEITSILVDKERNTYIVSVGHPTLQDTEVVWKEIINPTKTVEVEYSVNKKDYPNESIEE